MYTIFLALSLVSAGNLICLACYSLKFSCTCVSAIELELISCDKGWMKLG